MKPLYRMIIGCLGFVLFAQTLQAQFIHPGISHKLSDLDRVKYMVEAQIDPWYTSYQDMVNDSKSSYDYNVQGDASFTVLGRDDKTNYGAWNSDIRAAYYNAIRWYVEGNTRHADKAIEIFNAWKNLTSVTSGGTDALSGGVGYIMIEAAEIIRHTYVGWSASDIRDFEDMLVYPGYSTAQEPSGNTTFYWMSYQGDPGRHGNQGLSGWRTVMAMGVFLDNETMYQRALRYIKGLPHLSNDLPYPSGPPTRNSLKSSNEYYEDYSVTKGTSQEDYGFNEVMTNYIWENGQCQESSRDQQHTMFGIGLLTSMSEMAWNQGDNLYAHENDRLLLGLEYNMRYNTTSWTPSVASGEFIERDDRTLRWRSLAISPAGRGDFPGVRTVFEMPLAHYVGRGFKIESEIQYTLDARDMAIAESGYEKAGWTNDALGWGALTARRPMYCYGDPISGFSDSLPDYSMNIVPGTIEAENFDHSSVTGEGRIYHDADTINTGAKYRLNEGVDIDTCSEGGYQLSSLEDGEWLTYTVFVPASSLYNISIRYASANTNGKIKFSFDGEDLTGEVVVPFGDINSSGLTDYKDLTIATDAILSKGVQSMKISISGDSDSFVLNNISLEQGSEHACVESLPSITPSYRKEAGIKYYYYEGTWDNLPDFDALTPLEEGLTDSIKLMDGIATDSFALMFEGYIDISILGSYTFYTLSGEGSRLLIDGIEVVNNDGLHDAVEKSGSICLDEGFHDIRVEYFEKTGSEYLEVMFEGPGISKRNISGLYGIGPCTNNAITPPDNLVNGLKFFEYSGTWVNLPDFDMLTPVNSGITSAISTNVATASDYYGITFEGYILIEESGDYTFFTASDDGSSLYIDDMEVVSNDGTHGSVEKSGNLCLEAGYHKIRIEYFENSGGQSLSANIMGGGISKSLISNQQLFTEPFPKDDQLITFESLDTVVYGELIAFSPVVSSSSGLDVKLSSSNAAVATVAYDNKIWIRGIGTAIITASQAGDTFYNVAPDVQQTLVVTEAASGLKDIKSDNSILLYPNPVSDVLTIKQYKAGKAKLEIFNTLGKLVLATTISQEESNLDISKLPSGIYIAKICIDDYLSQQIIAKE